MVFIFFLKKTAKPLEQIPSKVWKYRWGLECRLELDGPASVSVQNIGLKSKLKLKESVS